MPSLFFINVLKTLVNHSRDSNRDLRLGQYLWNCMSTHKDFPFGDVTQQNLFIADKLWNIEANELLELIDNFEKTVEN